MADHEEVFKEIESEAGKPSAPQLRIYLLSETDLPTATLCSALPDYEVIVPHSKNEAALIRKMADESEHEYEDEAERVAKTLASLLIADCYLSCLYDDKEGRSQTVVEMRKSAGAPSFIKTDAGR